MNLAPLRRALITWYQKNARDLPWRRTRDPYAIWISEVMLQQTTVVAVVPFYERFLARFPTVQALSLAEEAEVLRLWEGLGYYSRARNLLRAAKVIVEQHGGDFPDDVAQLQSLPGIGRYTAGAIASFAFDRQAPIVEANTQRLYARLMKLESDPSGAEAQKRLWSFAEQLTPARSPGRFNQALMELGAVVCTPKEPDCLQCPIQSHCAAFVAGKQRDIPRPKVRAAPTELTHVAAAVCHEGRWLVRQYGPGERWRGLWDFPRVEIPHGPESNDNGIPALSRASRKDVEQQVEKLTGVAIQLGAPIRQIRHTVTRYRIRLLCFQASREAAAGETTHAGAANRSEKPPETLIASIPIRWVTTDELVGMPLSATARLLADSLSSMLPANRD